MRFSILTKGHAISESSRSDAILVSYLRWINTLFDEKIAGSIHFTPGNAYTTCDNGNRSGIHWDLVQIQRPEYGGGEITMDGS